VGLPFETYSRRVLDLVVVPRGTARVEWAEEMAERLTRSGGPDLYLAIACEERLPGSWEAFRERYESNLRRLARANGARGFDIERVAGEVISELYAPRGRGRHRTGLGTFSGAGSLLAWLTVVLRRRLADERRTLAGARRRVSGRRERERAKSPHPTDHPSEEMDPVVIVVDGETCTRFAEALKCGMGTLTTRERQALSGRFRDGLPQAEVARRMGVGEPRVSRLLGNGIDRLRDAVRAAFPGERWEELDRLRMALYLAVGEALERSPASPAPASPALEPPRSGVAR
jgi:RNA polymerase sigma factor (sigma-70 family)